MSYNIIKGYKNIVSQVPIKITHFIYITKMQEQF